MKKINVAYEPLKNTLNNNYSTSYQSQFDLNKYCQEKINELKAYLNFIKDDKRYPKFVNKFYKRMKEIIGHTTRIILASYWSSKFEIDKFFYKAISDIKDNYEKLTIKYCDIYYMNYNDVKNQINFDLHFQEFYNQLENLKKKYSKSYLYKQKVNNEIEKYKLYAGYDEIKNQIDRIVQKYDEKAELKEYDNVDNLIVEMCKEIEYEFSKTENKEEILNMIYQDVLRKYFVILSNTSFKDENVNKANELFIQFCLHLKNIYNGTVSISELDQILGTINFEDMDKELSILTNNRNFAENEQSDIYINILDGYSKSRYFYYAIDHGNDTLTLKTELYSYEKISKKTLNNKFISLEDILEDTKFLGVRIGGYVLLYSIDTYNIICYYIPNNEFVIKQFDISYFNHTTDYDMYKDKKFL